MLDAETLGISIRRDARDLYEAFWQPEAFTRWASGLSKESLERDGDGWIAQGPEGPIKLRFSPRNPFGVMDHWVDLGQDEGKARIVYVPLRIVANGAGAEVLLTLFRQPEMSAEKFAEDAAWVRRDLAALKRVAEG